MSDDEDALSWDGDEDRIDTPARTASSLPRGWRAVGRGSAEVSTNNVSTNNVSKNDVPTNESDAGDTVPAGDVTDGAAAPMGNVALVSFGVLAGVYALYVIGWVLVGFRLRDLQIAAAGVADFMFQGAMWLGIAAPVIWFLTVIHTTRHAPMWRRFAGLGLGVLLLVPWPFVMMGMLGS